MITNTDLPPQRYHFLLGMVKDLNVFPFDNDMKKASGARQPGVPHNSVIIETMGLKKKPHIP